MKACCIGCSVPSAAARPSIVVICLPCAASRERQARQHPLTVDMHGAGAALAVVAAFLGAGQVHVLAQRVQKGGAHIHHHAVVTAIDVQHRLGRPQRGGRRHRGRGRSGTGDDRDRREAGRPAEQSPSTGPLHLVFGFVAHRLLLALVQSCRVAAAARPWDDRHPQLTNARGASAIPGRRANQMSVFVSGVAGKDRFGCLQPAGAGYGGGRPLSCSLMKASLPGIVLSTS